MTENTKIYLHWDDIAQDAIALSEKLKAKGTFQGVVAVTTGGMLPACIVARMLKIKPIQTLSISTYTDGFDKQGEVHIFNAPVLSDGGRGWVIIDDLVDTGKTFEVARKQYPNATYACLYAKPQGTAQTDVYVKNYPQTTWLFFPWEIDDMAAARADAEKA